MPELPDPRREFNAIVGSSSERLSNFEVMRRAGETLTEACLQDQLNRVELLLSNVVSLTPFRPMDRNRPEWQQIIHRSIDGFNAEGIVPPVRRTAVAEYLNTVELAPLLRGMHMRIIVRDGKIVLDSDPVGGTPTPTPKPEGYDANERLQTQISLARTSLGGLQREWGAMRSTVSQTTATVSSMTSAYMLERARRAANSDLAGVQNIDRLIAIELFHDEGLMLWQDMLDVQRREVAAYLSRFRVLPADVVRQLQSQETVLQELKVILQKRMTNFRLLNWIRAYERDAAIDLDDASDQIVSIAARIRRDDPANPLTADIASTASVAQITQLNRLRVQWQNARDAGTRNRLAADMSRILDPIRDAIQRYDLGLMDQQASKLWTGPMERDERMNETRGIMERAFRWLPEALVGNPEEAQPVLRSVFVTRTLFLAHGKALGDAQKEAVSNRRPPEEQRVIEQANREFINRFIALRRTMGTRRRNISRILIGEGHLDLPHIVPDVIPPSINAAVIVFIENVRANRVTPTLGAINHHMRVVLRTEPDRQKFEYALNERLAGSGKMVRRGADNSLAVVDRALPTTDAASVTALLTSLDTTNVPSLDAVNRHLQGLRTEEEQRTFVYALNIRLAPKGTFAVRNIAANLNACTIQLISRPPMLDVVPEAMIPHILAVLAAIQLNPSAPVVDLTALQRHVASLRNDAAKDRFIDALNGWLSHTPKMIMRRLDAGSGRRTDTLELHERPAGMRIASLDQRSLERLATTRNESLGYELDYITQMESRVLTTGVTLEEYLDWYFFGVRLQGSVDEQNEQAMREMIALLQNRRSEAENMGAWNWRLPDPVRRVFVAGNIAGPFIHERRMQAKLVPLLKSLGLPENYFSLTDPQKREAMKNCPRIKDLSRIISQYRGIIEPMLVAMRSDSMLLRDLCNATDASGILRPKDLALASASRRPSWWAENEEGDIRLAQAIHVRMREINGGGDDIFQYFDTPAEIDALRRANISWWADRTTRPTDAEIRRRINFDAAVPASGDARKRMIEEILPVYFALLGRIQRRSDVRGGDANTMTDAAIRARLTVPADANDDVKQRMREEAKWVYERLLQRKDELDELYAPLHAGFRLAVDRNVNQHVDFAQFHADMDPSRNNFEYWTMDVALPIWLYWVGPGLATHYAFTRLIGAPTIRNFNGSLMPHRWSWGMNWYRPLAKPWTVSGLLRRIAQLPGEPVGLLADLIRGTPEAIGRYRRYAMGIENPQAVARRLATDIELPLTQRQQIGRGLCPHVPEARLNAAVADVHAFKNTELRTAYAELDAARASGDAARIRQAQRNVYSIVIEKRNRLMGPPHNLSRVDANKLVRSGVCGLEHNAIAARLRQMGPEFEALAREVSMAGRGTVAAERSAATIVSRTLPEGSHLGALLRDPARIARMTEQEVALVARELRALSQAEARTVLMELHQISNATPGTRQLRPIIQMRSAAAEAGHAAELLRIGKSAAVVLDIAMVALELYLVYESVRAYNRAVEASREQRAEMRRQLENKEPGHDLGFNKIGENTYYHPDLECTLDLSTIEQNTNADIDDAIRQMWITGSAAGAGILLTTLAATGAVSGGVTVVVGLVIVGIQMQASRISEKLKEDEYKNFIDACPVWLIMALGTYKTVKASPMEMFRRVELNNGLDERVAQKMLYMIWIQQVQSDPDSRALLSELLAGRTSLIDLQKFYDEVFVPVIYPAWKQSVFMRKYGRQPDMNTEEDRTRMRELVKDYYLFGGWVIGLGDIRTQAGASRMNLDQAMLDSMMPAIARTRVQRYWRAYSDLLLRGDHAMAQNAAPDAPGAIQLSTIVRELGVMPAVTAIASPPAGAAGFHCNRTIAQMTNDWIENNRGDRSVADFVRLHPEGPPQVADLHTRVTAPEELYAVIHNPVQRAQLLEKRRGRPGTVDTASWAPGYRQVSRDHSYIAGLVVHAAHGLPRPMTGVSYLQWWNLYARYGGVYDDEGQRAHEHCISNTVPGLMPETVPTRDAQLGEMIFGGNAVDRPVVQTAMRTDRPENPPFNTIRGWCKDLYTTTMALGDIVPAGMPPLLANSTRGAFAARNVRAVAFQGSVFSEGQRRRPEVNVSPEDAVRHYAINGVVLFDNGRDPPYYLRRTVVMRRVGESWRAVYGASVPLQESQLTPKERLMLSNTSSERRLRVTTDAMHRSDSTHEAAPEGLDDAANRFAERSDIANRLFAATRHRSVLFVHPPRTVLEPASAHYQLLETLTQRTSMSIAGEWERPEAYFVEFRERREGDRTVVEALSTIIPTTEGLRSYALIRRKAAVAYVQPDPSRPGEAFIRIDAGQTITRKHNERVDRSLWLSDAPSILYRAIDPAVLERFRRDNPGESEMDLRARLLGAMITSRFGAANRPMIDAAAENVRAAYDLFDDEDMPPGFVVCPSMPDEQIMAVPGTDSRALFLERLPEQRGRRLQLSLRYESTRGVVLRPVDLYFPQVPNAEQLRAYSAVIDRQKSDLARRVGIRSADISVTYLTSPEREGHDTFFVESGRTVQQYTASSLTDLFAHQDFNARKTMVNLLTTPMYKQEGERWEVDAQRTLQRILRYVSSEVATEGLDSRDELMNRLLPMFNRAPDKQFFLKRLIGVLVREGGVRRDNLDRIVTARELQLTSANLAIVTGAFERVVQLPGGVQMSLLRFAENTTTVQVTASESATVLVERMPDGEGAVERIGPEGNSDSVNIADTAFAGRGKLVLTIRIGGRIVMERMPLHLQTTPFAYDVDRELPDNGEPARMTGRGETVARIPGATNPHLLLRRVPGIRSASQPNAAWGRLYRFGNPYSFTRLNNRSERGESFWLSQAGSLHAYIPVTRIGTILAGVDRSVGAVELDGENRRLADLWAVLRENIGETTNESQPLISLDPEKLEKAFDALLLMERMLGAIRSRRRLSANETALVEMLSECNDELSKLGLAADVRTMLTSPRESIEPGEPGFSLREYEAPIRNILDLFLYRENARDPSGMPRSRTIRQLTILYWQLGKDVAPDVARRKRSEFLTRIYDALQESAKNERRLMLERNRGVTMPEWEKTLAVVTAETLDRIWVSEALRIRFGATERDGQLRVVRGGKAVAFAEREGSIRYSADGGTTWHGLDRVMLASDVGDSADIASYFNRSVLPDIMPGISEERKQQLVAERGRSLLTGKGATMNREEIYTLTLNAPPVIPNPEDAPVGQRRTARGSTGTLTFEKTGADSWSCVAPEVQRHLTWGDTLIRENTIAIVPPPAAVPITAQFRLSDATGWNYRMGTAGGFRSVLVPMQASEVRNRADIVAQWESEILSQLHFRNLWVSPAAAEFDRMSGVPEFVTNLERIREQRASPHFQSIEAVVPREQNAQDDDGIQGEEELVPEACLARYISAEGYTILTPQHRGETPDPVLQPGVLTPSQSFRFGTVRDGEVEADWQSIAHIRDLGDARLSQVLRQRARTALTTPRAFNDTPQAHRQSLQAILLLCDHDVGTNHRGELTDFGRDALTLLEPMYLRAVDKAAFLDQLVSVLIAESSGGRINQDVLDRLRRDFERAERTERFVPEINPTVGGTIDLGSCRLRITPEDSARSLRFSVVAAPGAPAASLSFMEQYSENLRFGLYDLREGLLPQAEWSKLLSVTVSQGGREVVSAMPIRIRLTGAMAEARERVLQARRVSELNRSLQIIDNLSQGGDWPTVAGRFLRSAGATFADGVWTIADNRKTVAFRFRDGVAEFRGHEGAWRALTASVAKEECGGDEALAHRLTAGICPVILDLRYPDRALERFVGDVNAMIPDVRFTREQTLASQLERNASFRSGRRLLANKQGIIRLVEREGQPGSLELLRTDDIRRECNNRLAVIRSVRSIDLVRRGVTEIQPLIRLLQDIGDPYFRPDTRVMTLGCEPGGYILVPGESSLNLVYAPFEQMPTLPRETTFADLELWPRHPVVLTRTEGRDVLSVTIDVEKPADGPARLRYRFSEDVEGANDAAKLRDIGVTVTPLPRRADDGDDVLRVTVSLRNSSEKPGYYSVTSPGAETAQVFLSQLHMLSLQEASENRGRWVKRTSDTFHYIAVETAYRPSTRAEDAPVGQRRSARFSSGARGTFEKTAANAWTCAEPESDRGLIWSDALMQSSTQDILSSAASTHLAVYRTDGTVTQRLSVDGRSWIEAPAAEVARLPRRE